MHFSVSGHVTLGVVRWRHELDYICPLRVLSKFGPIEAYMCRVIANHKITKSSSSTRRHCLESEAFDIWWCRVKSRSWTKFKQSNYIVSLIHYGVKSNITSAWIETCWCWWWRPLFFSEQFLISYTVIPVITYSLDKLVCNTLAITLNVLSKAILRIHGMNI